MADTLHLSLVPIGIFAGSALAVGAEHLWHRRHPSKDLYPGSPEHQAAVKRGGTTWRELDTQGQAAADAERVADADRSEGRPGEGGGI